LDVETFQHHDWISHNVLLLNEEFISTFDEFFITFEHLASIALVTAPLRPIRYLCETFAQYQAGETKRREQCKVEQLKQAQTDLSLFAL